MYKMAKELPIGFAMKLSANSQAMQYYASLNKQQQHSIVEYIQNNQSELEAREKINNAIRGLENNSIDFI